MSNWTIKEKFNLPENWEVMRLHDLTTQIVDGTHFTPNYIENGIPFLRVTDIQSKNIDFTGLKFISKEEHDLLKLRCSPSKGDILLSKNGSIGIIKIVDWDWEFSIFVSLALLKTKKEIYNQYIKYLLQSEIVWWQIKLRAKQGTVTNLHLEEIRELEIPKPSLPEQTRIAQILTTTDAVIEKTQAVIAKYKAIKQGMLHDLFTRGIDPSTNKLRPSFQEAPELYKESKLGWIPKEWEVDTLENTTDYVDYRGKTPPKSEFGVYLVTARNIKDGYIDYEISKEYIREDSFESAMSRGKVKMGDVLITTEAPMGNVAQIDKEDIALAQRVIKYRGHECKLNNNFLAKLLMSEIFQKQLYIEGTGSTVLGIKGSRLHKLSILLPKLPEQGIIVERINSIDNKLQSEQTYLQKLQQIKKGLMEDLLSGKKCLNL